MFPKSQDVKFQGDALKGIIQTNPLSSLFFSKDNIDALQQGIRYLVYEQSCKKHIIDRQSDEDLKIVMRSIYLQHAKHQPINIQQQVIDLNKEVLRFCVPKILNEIDAYLAYRSEITKNPEPIARSQNVNNTGTKTLELKTF